MARLPAEIRTSQEKMDAKMDISQAEMLVRMIVKIGAPHKRAIAKMDTCRQGTEACVGKFEGNPEKSEAVAEHREVARKRPQ
jgi:hypothetical protein